MNLFPRIVMGLTILSSLSAQAQKLKKADKLVISQLQAHIGYLADDKLEGRRAGSNGESLARTYISKQFETIGLEPKGDNNGWFQAFPIFEGKDYHQNSYLFINGNEISREHFFPYTLSPEKIVEAMPSIALKEAGVPWFIDLAAEKEANQGNPHFDAENNIQEKIKSAAAKGATALILFNDPDQRYNPKQRGDQLPIPVFFLDSIESKKYLSDETEAIEIKAKAGFTEKQRSGTNVIGYINNGAAYTILVGAHFDHLGYGEDGNSMLRTGEKLIHNGADDNASGTAALIELARLIKKDKAKKANYLFIAFSAEELGLFGSKYFTENPPLPLSSVSYMINMDMVGRLNDSSHTMTIGGYGTSPTWNSTFSALADNRYIKFKFDSSGTGPSDHSSFYRKDIPVLFFFTGLHTDYHKPSDDASRINYEGEYRIVQLVYDVIKKTPADNKLVFTKTREQQTGTSTRFSVSMGIMPDYSFSGNGVRVDGVSDGRPAKKAGIQAGDVIVQLGDFRTGSVEQYMQALGKFKKGDKTTVRFKRAEAELSADIQF
ncbi:M20/M25/M40 family metallo-hydrolase [Flavihumibacter fluvii]|uniref:M20/M25/M40 family metallo-hydrolase n=1 Tax=Flavihumibacter fluvii TaxID=2838157 RepID=UPI001BDF5047|nr:M20/M25/M40 family metallo-hydrolase [Flavihumibacter fluvii]ULQ51841.1 M28 family peptidase [Flavihumibacter fluvii]